MPVRRQSSCDLPHLLTLHALQVGLSLAQALDLGWRDIAAFPEPKGVHGAPVGPSLAPEPLRRLIGRIPALNAVLVWSYVAHPALRCLFPGAALPPAERVTAGRLRYEVAK